MKNTNHFYSEIFCGVVLILVHFVRSAAGSHFQCGINEVFSETGGPLCEGCGANCQVFVTEPKCNCLPGYRRIQSNPGVCIPEGLCPGRQPVISGNSNQCGINEVYSPAGGRLCEGCGITCQAIIDTPGCYCRTGFRRIQSNPGVCIPEELCPRISSANADNPNQCGINEVYSPTGGRLCEGCGITCQAIIDTPGCYCRTGFRRIQRNPGVCIPEELCPGFSPASGPGQCGINEFFSPTGGPLCQGCGFNCEAVSNESGCYCLDGYRRIQTNPGVCIPEELCPENIPPICPINEEPGCEQPKSCVTCEFKYTCPTFVCTKGCNCIQGFYRNKQGVCIPEALCPNPNIPICGVNEEYSEDGGPLCEGCGPRCAALSLEPRCYCKRGFSRISPNACIPDNLCPPT